MTPRAATSTARVAVSLFFVLQLAACGEAPSAGGRVDAGPAERSAQFRGGASHRGVYVGGGFRQLGGVAWSVCTGGSVRSSAAVADGVVFVGSADGALRALDLESGELLWRYDAGAPIASSPAVAGGLVVAGSRDGRVHAVRVSDGSAAWTVDAGPDLPMPWGREGWDYFTASPTVVGGEVLLAGGDGVLRRVRLADGTMLGEIRLGTRLRSSPAESGGLAFLGGADGVVYAVDLAADSVVWRQETEGASLESAAFGFDRRTVQASPAVSDGRAYVGGRDGRLYALDAATGERAWVVEYAPSWVVSSTAVGGGTVYTGTSDAHVVEALDAATGERRWRVDMGNRVLGSPSLVGDVLLVPGNDGVLTALDAGSGDTLWRFAAGDMIQASPVVAGDLVVFGDDSGHVFALRGADSADPAAAAADTPDSVGARAGAAAASPRLAVFYDTALARFASTSGGARMADDLQEAGYSVLDAEALGRFLADRAADRAPSVVVFAIDHVPAGVAPESGDPGLLRRYLEAGGKVVWTGIPPLALVRDSTGTPTAFEPGRAAAVTGVDLSSADASDYGARPTGAGRHWGLRRVRLSSFAPDSAAGATVLATNELGRPAAWVRSFGGPEGTGFVFLWGRGYRWGLVEEIRRVAEHGVLARPDAFRAPAGCPAD